VQNQAHEQAPLPYGHWLVQSLLPAAKAAAANTTTIHAIEIFWVLLYLSVLQQPCQLTLISAWHDSSPTVANKITNPIIRWRPFGIVYSND